MRRNQQEIAASQERNRQASENAQRDADAASARYRSEQETRRSERYAPSAPPVQQRSACMFCGGSGLQDCPCCVGGWSPCIFCQNGAADCPYCAGGCELCGGRGYTACQYCNGNGGEPCTVCRGQGATACTFCNGSGVQ